MWCASEAEAERWRQLKELEAAGTIENLKHQVTFELVVNNQMICRYRADAAYDVMGERGEILRHVVEDTKGMQTDEFKLKRKLFDALQPQPLSVIEVKGKAIHPTRPLLSEKTSKPVRSTAGWMCLHWKGRIPD